MRLPSFNDFSVGIIKDIRVALVAIRDNQGKSDEIIKRWSHDFFGGSNNKRSSTNIPVTLHKLGLFDREAASLTDVGNEILQKPTKEKAAARFVRHIIESHNGLILIDALKGLGARGERPSKDSIKRELISLGVKNLSQGTTDHTTLAGWMAEAGIIEPSPSYAPIDVAMKALLGISSEERDEFQSLTTAQQIFLKIVRRLHEVDPSKPIPAKLITDECLSRYRYFFDDDQLSAKISKPLEAKGWISLSGRAATSAGGKSGFVTPEKKILDIPLAYVLPDVESVVPADLRRKLNTPAADIQKLLSSSSKNDRGLGLELLALRMLIHLDLQPRSFRKRAKDTAYAEIDLTAEGTNLIFSRWNWQCKCVNAAVPLGDVAKEVGLAVYSKSHVVAMVTTSRFSREAVNYANEITSATHLQFVFIDGTVVSGYLRDGPRVLIKHVMKNAEKVMSTKRAQPINAETAE